MEPSSSMPRKPHISHVHAGNEIDAKYSGSETLSIKIQKCVNICNWRVQFLGYPSSHYVCKNPSQMIMCVAGAVEALSTQQGSVSIEGL